MNHPIRCEPLLFSVGTGKAAAEAPLCPKAEKSNFGELLEAELDNPDEEKFGRKPKPDQSAPELWALPATTQLPLIQQDPIPEGPAHEKATIPNAGVTQGLGLISETSSKSDTTLSESDNAETQSSETIPNSSRSLENAEPAHDSIRGRDKPSAVQLAIEQGGAGVPERIQALAPKVQKVPSATLANAPEMAQISEKGPETAGFARGMVAAQAPSMLLASPEAEEKAPLQGSPLSAAIGSFESRTLPQTPREAPHNPDVSSRHDAESKVELSEVTILTELGADWPEFGTISETRELSPSRPVEPTAVLEAIRTHVQLLKSSSQDRIEVILRPDSNTALLLKVESVNGQIQVQARCDRGDFALLDANWSSIQSTLATQGIRVEPLQMSGTNLQKESSSGFDQHASQRQEPEQSFIEQEIRNRKTTRQSAPISTAVRGWQSWA